MPRIVDFDPFADEDETSALLKTPRDLGIDVLDAEKFVKANQLDLTGPEAVFPELPASSQYDPFAAFKAEGSAAKGAAFAEPAKGPAGPGLFGSSFGMLSPEESQADLQARKAARATGLRNIEALETQLRTEMAKPMADPRRAKSLQMLIEQARTSLPSEATLQAMEQGTAPLASKTALRSGIENAARGFGDTVVAIPEFAGIIKGYLQPGQVDDDALVKWSLGAKDWLQRQFPGDAARQEDMSQMLASGAGQIASFYGTGALAALAKAGPKAMAAVLAGMGSSAVGSAGFEEGTAELKAARDKAAAEGRTSDVTEYDRLLKTLGYAALGATEAIPIMRTFQRVAPEPTSRFGARVISGIEGGAEEAAQEAGSQFGQNVVTQNTTDPSRNLGQGVAESGGVGGILGALLGLALPGLGGAAKPARPSPGTAPSTTPAVGPSGGGFPEAGEIDRGEIFPIEGQPGEANVPTGVVGGVGQPALLPPPAVLSLASVNPLGEAGGQDSSAAPQRQALRDEVERQVRATPALAPMMADIITKFDENPQAQPLIEQAISTIGTSGKTSRAANALVRQLATLPQPAEVQEQFGGTQDLIRLPQDTPAPVPSQRPTASATPPEVVPLPKLDDALFAIGGAGTPERDIDALGYYSKALEVAKGLPGRANVQQVFSTLSNAGVKDGEIAATGLDRWLLGNELAQQRRELVEARARVSTLKSELGQRDIQPDRAAAIQAELATQEPALAEAEAQFAVRLRGSNQPPKSREDIVKFLTERRVRLEESVRSKSVDKERLAQRQFGRSYNSLNEDDREVIDDMHRVGGYGQGRQPKWAKYSLDPSNPTYTETVLHLPANSLMEKLTPDQLAAREEAQRPFLARLREIDAEEQQLRPGDGANRARLQFKRDRAQTEMWEAMLKAAPDPKEVRDWTSGHWPEPNIVAHERTQQLKTTDGRTSLNLDELQSDEGQKIREGGLADPEKAQRLWEEMRTAANELNELRHAIDSTVLYVIQGAVADAQKTAMVDQLRGGAARRYMFNLERGEYGLESPSRAYAANSIAAIAPEDVAGSLRTMAKKHDELTALKDRIEAEALQANQGAVGHPLVNTTDQWVETALRNLIKQAVDANVDGISITPGAVQNERFNLSSVIDSAFIDLQMYEDEGNRSIIFRQKGGFVPVGSVVVDPDGMVVDASETMPESKGQPLSAVVGERGAKALMTARDGDIVPVEEMELGGEGMRATYDKMYPSKLGKLLQKLDKSIKPERVKLNPHNYTGRERISLDELRKDTPFANDFTFFPLTEQAKQKIREEGQPLFALAPAGKRLVAMHNLSEENLAFVDNLGGLPVPSIGVIREGTRFADDGFGNITLIGRKSMADPATAPVFDADAYTVRFPKAIYKPAPAAKIRELVALLTPMAKQFGDHRAPAQVEWHMRDEPKPDEVALLLKNSVAGMAAYLHSKNQKLPEPVTQPALRNSRFPWVAMPSFQAFLAGGGDKADPVAFTAAAKQALEEYIHADGDQPVSPYNPEGKATKDSVALLRAALSLPVWFDATIGQTIIDAYDRSSILSDVQKIGQTALDYIETRRRLESIVKSDIAGLSRWADELVRNAFGTPSLKLRGRTVPFTLDNIVEAMTGRQVRGREKIMGMGEGALRGQTARRFKSLEEMRKTAQERILEPWEIEAAQTASYQLMEAFRTELAPYYGERDWRGNVDSWGAMDAAMRALARVLKKSKTVRPGNLRAALRAEGFRDVPDAVVDKGVLAAQTFITTPVPYFEAKPQRSVALSEFAGAVVPDTASERTLDILRRHGIPYRTYERNGLRGGQSEAARDFAKELAEADEDVLFALKGFYNPAIRAVEQSETKQTNPQGWWNRITKAKNVRHEELRYMGLKPWLDGLPQNQPLHREQLLDFMRAHQTELTEVLREDTAALEQDDELQEQADQAWEAAVDAWIDRNDEQGYSPSVSIETVESEENEGRWTYKLHTGNSFDHWNTVTSEDEFDSEEEAEQAAEVEREQLEDQVRDDWATETRYNYDGDSYDEILTDLIEKSDRKVQWEDEVIGGGQDYKELLIRYPKIHQVWRSPHMGDHEIAYIRFDRRYDPERNQNILKIQEIQSDLHQRARKAGYRSDENLTLFSDLWNDEDIRERRQAYWDWMLARSYGASEGSIYDAQARMLAATNKSQAKVDSGAKALGVTASHLNDMLNRDNQDDAEHAYLIQTYPDAPYKGSDWWQLAFKRVLQYAVENDFDAIAFPTGNQVSNSVGMPEEAAVNFYEGDLPNFARKYAKQWGAEIERRTIPGIPNEYVSEVRPDITPQMAIRHFQLAKAKIEQNQELKNKHNRDRNLPPQPMDEHDRLAIVNLNNIIEALEVQTTPEQIYEQIRGYGLQNLARSAYLLDKADYINRSSEDSPFDGALVLPGEELSNPLVTTSYRQPVQQVLPITEAMRQDINAVGQPLAAGATRDEVKRHIEAFVKMGRSVSVPKAIQEQTFAAIEPARAALPDDTDSWVISKISPGSEKGRVTAQFVNREGDTYDLEGALADLFESRAFHLRGSVGVAPGVFLVPLTASSKIQQLARGELRHEAIHALRGQDRFSASVWGSLVSHANQLQIMGMRLKDYLEIIGSESAEAADPEQILADAYYEAYKHRSDLFEVADQEAVAHMVELYSHGALTKQQLGPVLPIVEAIFSGKFSRGTPEDARDYQPQPLRRTVPAPILSLLERQLANDISEFRQDKSGKHSYQEGEKLPQRVSAPPAVTPGRQAGERSARLGDSLGRRPIEDRLLRQAINEYLGDYWTPQSALKRAKLQGFTLPAWHATKAEFEIPDPRRAYGDFGFHVAVGSPESANDRGGFDAADLEMFFAEAHRWPEFKRKNWEDRRQGGRLLPLLVKAKNPIRMPDLGSWVVPEMWINWANGVVNWPGKEGPHPYRDTARKIAALAETVLDDFSATGAETITRFYDYLTAILEGDGFDSVIYKNDFEGVGNDSLFVWRSENVRSVFDTFDPRAVGRPGLMASVPFLEADMRTELNAALAEEGLSFGEQYFALSAVNQDGKPIKDDPEFKAWFGDSKVVDENGDPLIVYHATLNEFSAFNRYHANIESDMGMGFYFTSEPEDSSRNYGHVGGADVNNKIQRLIETYDGHEDVYAEIEEANEGKDPDDPDYIDVDTRIREEARSQLGHQHEGMSIPVYLKIENPVVLGTDPLSRRPETVFDYQENYDEDSGEYGEPTGSLVAFADALREAMSGYYIHDEDAVIHRLFELGADGVTASELVIILKSSDSLASVHDDETGQLAMSEIIREAFENMGFDGIIDHTVFDKWGPSRRRFGAGMSGVREDTTHYIAFKPTQIKSVFNRGTFDPNDPDILHAFAGEKSKGANTTALNQAKQQLSEKVDPDKVWHDTGWMLDIDNRWKYEIDDSKAKFVLSPSEMQLVSDTNMPVRLGDVITHAELFRNYPQLKNLPVRFWDDLEDNRMGGFALGTRAPWGLGWLLGHKPARLSINLGHFPSPAEDPEQKVMMRTIMHEVQHAIQAIEDFAGGANPQDEGNLFADRLRRNALSARDYATLKSQGFDYMLGMIEALRDNAGHYPKDSAQYRSLQGQAEQGERILISAMADALYYRSAGEIEARATDSRVGFDANLRRNFRPNKEGYEPVEISQTFASRGDYGSRRHGMYSVVPLRPGMQVPQAGAQAPVADYVNASLEAADDRAVSVEALYKDYHGWAKSEGKTPLPPKAFAQQLRDQGFRPHRIAGAERYFVSIRGADPDADKKAGLIGTLYRRAKQLLSKGGVPEAKVREQTGWTLKDGEWTFQMTEAARNLIEGKPKKPEKK